MHRVFVFTVKILNILEMKLNETCKTNQRSVPLQLQLHVLECQLLWRLPLLSYNVRCSFCSWSTVQGILFLSPPATTQLVLNIRESTATEIIHLLNTWRVTYEYKLAVLLQVTLYVRNLYYHFRELLGT